MKLARKMGDTIEQPKWVEAPLEQVMALGYAYESFSLRGDGTKSGARRMQMLIGAERMKHLHYDTCVTDRRTFFLSVPMYRHPGLKDLRAGFDAEYWWCMAMIHEGDPEVVDAPANIVDRIRHEELKALESLPDFRWVAVRNVKFHCDNKPKTRKPKQDVVYFRFAGGAGFLLASCLKEKPKARAPNVSVSSGDDYPSDSAF